jgi:hypothetical protein
LFHPKWWASQGFGKPDEQMMVLAIELGVDNLCNFLKQALKHKCLAQKIFCKFQKTFCFVHPIKLL